MQVPSATAVALAKTAAALQAALPPGAPLQRAYHRLAALESSPQRNARHVLKVLVKFWLLQVGRASIGRLIEHFSRARYARVIHQRYFPGLTYDQMFEQTARQLCHAGAAALDGPLLIDVSRNA